MATFNTYVKLGTRGNSLLSFNLSGCTNSNTNSCTALPDYQDVLHTRFDGSGLYVTGLTLHSTYFIYVEANRQVLGSNCNPLLTKQMIPITGIPTPTPTPTSTPTNTPVPTATPTPTPIVCSFDGTVVYGLSGTATPTPTNTTAPSPATYTPTPTPTPTPSCVTSVQFEVVSGGDVRYVDCCGNTEYANVGAGPEVINGCIQIGSLFQVGASITDISYGSTSCSCVITPTPTSTLTPTATPYRIVANDLWVGDPGDVEFGDNTSCTHTSPINAIYDGVDAWLYSATNICDATSVETDNALGFNWVSAEMSPDQYIWISQTGITYDSTLGNYVRLYKRSGSTNTLLPSGTCINCLSINEPTPTPTPIPQITVNIYGRQNTPYDAVSNNLQLVYQTYNTTLGPVNNTTSGIQKSIIEGETFLVSPSVDAGGYLNLGAFLRVTDSTCDYVEVNVNVFAAGAYLSSRFTNSAGSLLSDYGCGLQGSINGVSIPVSQSIDVYITPTSTGVCLGSALTPPGLECLNTGS